MATKPIKVAVMGCVVNGPGEAKEADIGVAGGDGCGVICKNESHSVPYWVPNDDAGLLTSETETGTCTVCGDTVSQIIPNTATYATIFADIDLLNIILALVTTIVEGFALI